MDVFGVRCESKLELLLNASRRAFTWDFENI